MAEPTKTQKNGKAPISAKGKNVAEFYMGAPKSDFDIPAECAAELKSKGYGNRWIDIAQLKKAGNHHRQGWVPYKFDCLSGKTKNNPFMDSSLDGFLVRKGMVLAIKDSEDIARQKQFVKRRTHAQANAGQQAVDAFKEFAKQEKSMKVHEGFDGDEE
jgi:hypothetical protein